MVIRPAYTMGGTGGGLVYNLEELRVIVARGLAASMVGQVLVEESVLGWEELELEVVRDAKDQMITVCFIENVDAMGVHTGDSFCTAPMLTIAPELQQRLQEYSYDIVRAIEVIGGTNVQFAHDPATGRVVVIEINPRTSRSSALASKATGFPIALVSSRLAGGLTMDEIPYWRDGTLEQYTPSGDYVVVKFARWAFEKFPGAEDKLGTQMRAVGEVMSHRQDLQGSAAEVHPLAGDRPSRPGLRQGLPPATSRGAAGPAGRAQSERQFIMYEALRKGADVDLLSARTHIKPWFIEQMQELVQLEEEVLGYRGKELPAELLVRAKKDGFADAYLAGLLGSPRRTSVRRRRLRAWCRATRRCRSAAWRTPPTTTPPTTPPTGAGQRPPEDHGAGRGPQPHRPGHRVRLLLRPRGLRPARGRLRIHHGQLQPRNGLARTTTPPTSSTSSR